MTTRYRVKHLGTGRFECLDASLHVAQDWAAFIRAQGWGASVSVDRKATAAAAADALRIAGALISGALISGDAPVPSTVSCWRLQYA